MASNPPPAIEIPEPQPVAEAGVTTSEWKVLLGYAIQLAAAGTGTLVARATGAHLDATTLQVVGGVELALLVAGSSYIVSRAIRKLGTTA